MKINDNNNAIRNCKVVVGGESQDLLQSLFLPVTIESAKNKYLFDESRNVSYNNTYCPVFIG